MNWLNLMVVFLRYYDFPKYIGTTGLSRFSVNVSERYVDLYSDTMVVLCCGYKGSVHVSYDSNINNCSTLCAFSLFNVLFCFVYVLVVPFSWYM